MKVHVRIGREPFYACVGFGHLAVTISRTGRRMVTRLFYFQNRIYVLLSKYKKDDINCFNFGYAIGLFCSGY